MNRPRWHLAAPALLAVLAACGEAPSTPDPVASLSVSPAQPVVMRGDTLRVAAVAYDASGNALGGRAVTWSSSAPDIVSVSATGLLTGVGRGAATITASSGGLSQAVPVTVTAAPRRRPASPSLPRRWTSARPTRRWSSRPPLAWTRGCR